VSDKEILQRAIELAIERGWKTDSPNAKAIIDWFERGDPPMYQECIIFNHEFAKALWGERDWKDIDIEERPFGLWDGGPEWFEFNGKMWQYHLQQMVISPDPIKYLGENI
jgi:hypothetical protein